MKLVCEKASTCRTKFCHHNLPHNYIKRGDGMGPCDGWCSQAEGSTKCIPEGDEEDIK